MGGSEATPDTRGRCCWRRFDPSHRGRMTGARYPHPQRISGITTLSCRDSRRVGAGTPSAPPTRARTVLPDQLNRLEARGLAGRALPRFLLAEMAVTAVVRNLTLRRRASMQRLRGIVHREVLFPRSLSTTRLTRSDAGRHPVNERNLDFSPLPQGPPELTARCLQRLRAPMRISPGGGALPGYTSGCDARRRASRSWVRTQAAHPRSPMRAARVHLRSHFDFDFDRVPENLRPGVRRVPRPGQLRAHHHDGGAALEVVVFGDPRQVCHLPARRIPHSLYEAAVGRPSAAAAAGCRPRLAASAGLFRFRSRTHFPRAGAAGERPRSRRPRSAVSSAEQNRYGSLASRCCRPECAGPPQCQAQHQGGREPASRKSDRGDWRLRWSSYRTRPGQPGEPGGRAARQHCCLGSAREPQHQSSWTRGGPGRHAHDAVVDGYMRSRAHTGTRRVSGSSAAAATSRQLRLSGNPLKSSLARRPHSTITACGIRA